MFIKYFLTLILLVALPAEAGQNKPDTDAQIRQVMESVTDSTKLPGSGLMMFETKDNGLIFITEDARYIIRGSLHDKWHGKDVDSVQTARRIADITPVETMGIDFNTLNTASLGGVSQRATVFMRPMAQDVQQVASFIRNRAPDRSYQLVFVPGNTKRSLDRFSALACMSKMDRDSFASTLFDEEITLSNLDEQSCTPDPLLLARTSVATRFLGIRTLPTAITETGFTLRGDLVHTAKSRQEDNQTVGAP
ncbi:hypothetical protein GCM10023116_15950 [Kistimonas scapharcae]|uniref:Disulphide bond isomerase DsbC/G N-terminal domain-containing protein n=1 Tax=Kistimonas scapharcae TaxID=1036133 RepID=A0ABP8V0L4_9GAMM